MAKSISVNVFFISFIHFILAGFPGSFLCLSSSDKLTSFSFLIWTLHSWLTSCVIYSVLSYSLLSRMVFTALQTYYFNSRKPLFYFWIFFPFSIHFWMPNPTNWCSWSSPHTSYMASLSLPWYSESSSLLFLTYSFHIRWVDPFSFHFSNNPQIHPLSLWCWLSMISKVVPNFVCNAHTSIFVQLVKPKWLDLFNGFLVVLGWR